MNSAIRKEIKEQGMRVKHVGGALELWQGNTCVMGARSLKEIGAMMREGESEVRAIYRIERARMAR